MVYLDIQERGMGDFLEQLGRQGLVDKGSVHEWITQVYNNANQTNIRLDNTTPMCYGKR
jgi:hypothetical protein